MDLQHGVRVQEVLGVACWRNSRTKVPNHVLPFLYYFSSSVHCFRLLFAYLHTEIIQIGAVTAAERLII